MGAVANRTVADEMETEKQIVVEKIDRLSSERLTEVNDFIECLLDRESDSALTHAAGALGEASFAQVWDDPDDAAYDEV